MKTNLSKYLTGLFLVMLSFIQGCVHEAPPFPLNGGIPTQTVKCDPDTVYFRNEILPLLASNCAMPGCHDALTSADGVRLDSYLSLFRSGVVDPGNPSNSNLWEAINETDPEDRMPLNANPLTPEQKSLILLWIQQGARNNSCSSDCDSTIFTFSAGIKPILDTYCVGCHKTGSASAGVVLENYSSVKPYALNGTLYGASSHQNGYKPMPYGSTMISDCNLYVLKKWIDAGAPNN
ncbi:MAG: c-type cytochrome domain-containing protein [Bacteroidia bacterium]